MKQHKYENSAHRRALVRALLLWLLVSCGATIVRAQETVIFTANAIIAAGDTTHDGKNVIVRGTTVTIDGTHSFASLTVERNAANANGVVTHTAGLLGGMNLTVTGNVNVKQFCSISVSGRGYGANDGPGEGESNPLSGGGGGASYGGEGTAGRLGATPAAGAIYGDVKNPTELGSGGGYGYGGDWAGASGGGAIRLTVNGTLQVDGRLEANGLGNVHGGSGSGGSIYLNVGILTGNGLITAYGGSGNQGGAGGGGRIAIYSINFFSGTLSAGGGSSDTGRAAAGTIFQKTSSQTQGDLLVHNDGNAGRGTVLIGPHTFDNVRVSRQGVLAPPYGGTLDVTVLGNCIVDSGNISASGRGHGARQGPGKGVNNPLSGGGGGASYGGEGTAGRLGATPAAGAIYGDLRDPADLGDGEHLGSGGGYGYSGDWEGASGGGAIRLTVNGTLQVDGRLEANGLGNVHGGSGSGGSIYLNVGILTGNGLITAYGGSGNQGGAGGGGRIAVYYSTNNFTGVLSAGGGSSDTGRAGAGTIFLKSPSQTQGDIWVHNDGNFGRGTVLIGPHTFDNVRMSGQGVLAPPYGGTLDVTVLGDCVITSGHISANGRGYAGEQGPGKGGNNPSSGGGGGASYGGTGTRGRLGTNPPPGIEYGSEQLPTDLGSGGGYGYSGDYAGAAGGGAIRLTVNGTLQVDGRLEANGLGNTHGGSGSGGSLLLRAGLLTGSGLITVYGGSGNQGGAGGGGRIAIYYAANTFSGTLSAAGGSSDTGTGEAGTIYQAAILGNFTITLDLSPTTIGSGQTALGTITLSAPAPEGGLAIALESSIPAVATVSPSVTIPEGQTVATFTVTANSVTTTRTANITARLWDRTSSATLTVQPWLASLRVNPSSVNGGATASVTLTLSVPAPANGLPVAFSSSDSVVSMPATLTIPAGATTRTFSVPVGTVGTARTVTLRATYLSELKTATLYVNPTSVQVRSVAVSPASVVGGNAASGVVTLTAVAPPGGAIVALSSGDPATASVPASVTVPAGRTSASFTVTTRPVASPQSVILSASLGVTRMTTLTVRLPGVASLSLVPSAVSGGETSIGVVTLDAVPTSPVTVTITSNRTQAIPESSIVIPAGQTTGSFVIDTTAVTATTVATITARANGIAKSQMLTISP